MAKKFSNEWMMNTAGNAFSFVLLYENYASWVKANKMDEEPEEGAENAGGSSAQRLFAF